LASSRTRRM